MISRFYKPAFVILFFFGLIINEREEEMQEKLLVLLCIIWLLFTPVSITTLIGTEDARFILNGISPIAKGNLKWRDALLVTGTVTSNKIADSIQKDKIDK